LSDLSHIRSAELAFLRDAIVAVGYFDELDVGADGGCAGTAKLCTGYTAIDRDEFGGECIDFVWVGYLFGICRK